MDILADRDGLYAEFGMAAEQSQLLETEAGNVALAFVGLLLEPGQMTNELRELFRGVIDDVNRKTLGALLGHIKATSSILASRCLSRCQPWFVVFDRADFRGDDEVERVPVRTGDGPREVVE